MKLKEINYNVSADRNIFYSAYLRAPLQYNDVDPDKADKEKVDVTDVEEQKKEPIIDIDVKVNVPKLF